MATKTEETSAAAAEVPSVGILEEADENAAPTTKKCCSVWRFEGVRIAQGYNVLMAGRGPLLMSNIFLATALIYLASEEIGCVEENEEGIMAPIEDCDKKVYGAFQPVSLVTNIAVISGVLSACFMPVVGALIDFSPYRWNVGVVTAALLVAIQTIQIGTNSSTWFAMALLQTIMGFLYSVQNIVTYAYLPTLSGVVGEQRVKKYMPIFTITQFSSQFSFLSVVIVPSVALGLGDVRTAQLSQGLNSVLVGAAFCMGWNRLPRVANKHSLPPGKWWLTQGFVQNWNTAKEIQRHYKRSLRWFLLAVVFGEAAATAFTLVAVVFLDGSLGLTSSEIGLFFLIALVAHVPGGLWAQWITAKTNPKLSWCMSMGALFVLAIAGSLPLNKDNALPWSFVWGFGLGVLLGWYFPTEGMILSMCVPKSKEGEVMGFFVYCTQILVWLPPLVFTLLVEANVDQAIGVIAISGFFLVAIASMCMAAPWEGMLEEVEEREKTLQEQPSCEEEEEGEAETRPNVPGDGTQSSSNVPEAHSSA